MMCKTAYDFNSSTDDCSDHNGHINIDLSISLSPATGPYGLPQYVAVEGMRAVKKNHPPATLTIGWKIRPPSRYMCVCVCDWQIWMSRWQIYCLFRRPTHALAVTLRGDMWPRQRVCVCVCVKYEMVLFKNCRLPIFLRGTELWSPIGIFMGSFEVAWMSRLYLLYVIFAPLHCRKDCKGSILWRRDRTGLKHCLHFN